MGIIYSFINDLIIFRGLFKVSSFNKFKFYLFNYLELYIKFKKNINLYKKKIITQNDLIKKKKTDLIFIIGSGFSLNKISKKKWKIIMKNDTIGFNNTFYLKKTPITYHIARAGNEDIHLYHTLKNWIYFFQNKIKNNKFYNNTILFFPKGLTANFTNTLFGKKFYKIKNKLFLFRTNRISNLPKKNLNTGLLHRSGTLFDAISLAYYLRYKKIILLGVDLYDKRYFFAPKNKTITWDTKKNNNIFTNINEKKKSYLTKHDTVNKKMIRDIKELNFFLKKKKIKIFIENKRSLLKGVLKVYEW